VLRKNLSKKKRKKNPASCFLKQDAGLALPKKIKYSKAFTLIELLIVIAIIGILVAFFLARMNKIKNEARDAAIKKSLIEIQKTAELLYNNIGSYESVCDSSGNQTLSDEGDFGRIKAFLLGQIKVADGKIGCKSDDEHYAVTASLNVGGCWCVDYQGVSKKIDLSEGENCLNILTEPRCP